MGQEDPLEEGMAIHSSILAWRIPQTEAIIQRVTKSQAQLKWLSRHVQHLPSGGKGVWSYQALRSWGTAVQAFRTHRFPTHGYNQMMIESIWKNFLEFQMAKLNLLCTGNCLHSGALLSQLIKNAPAKQETLVWFLGQEDPLEKE